MTRLRSRSRRAFTLVEILVAVTILGIIGAGLVRMILTQARFTEKQMASRNARTVSRNAMNIMLTDLRMVQDNGGLIAASRESVTVRVPITFGLLCASAGGVSTVSLLPVDSAMTALGYYGGWAVRDSVSELYRYTDAATIIPFPSMSAGLAATCTATPSPAITPITYRGRTGRIVQLTDPPVGLPNPGWPVFVYHTITYAFAPSTALPGRIGLFRKIRTGASDYKTDEIIAPFDTAAKFRFHVLNEDTAQTGVPADLSTVRGLQLYLAGSSPGTPRESKRPAQQALVTGVFFKNRRDP